MVLQRLMEELIENLPSMSPVQITENLLEQASASHICLVSVNGTLISDLACRLYPAMHIDPNHKLSLPGNISVIIDSINHSPRHTLPHLRINPVITPPMVSIPRVCRCLVGIHTLARLVAVSCLQPALKMRNRNGNLQYTTCKLVAATHVEA